MFKKEFTSDDFILIEKSITGYLKSRTFNTYHGNKTFTNYSDIDSFLGLAYTSSGKYAGLYICNTEIKVPQKPEFNILGFVMDIENNSYAICSDIEENEFIFKLNITNKEDVLQNCTIEGCTIKLPPAKLERKLYEEVAKSLELIGGKWKGGKIMGFVFETDPTDLLSEIANGEKRNLKKEFQFFATPESLAAKMVQYAEVKENETILEPSAGQGAIIDEIRKIRFSTNNIIFIEQMPTNQLILNKKYANIVGVHFIHPLNDDFLEYEGTEGFDKIIANPPFTKNQDIDHIKKMYSVLNPGGRIVTMSSKHWQISSNKKEKDFKNWLKNEVHAKTITIDAGTFSESETKIESVLIIIDKPSKKPSTIRRNK